MKKPFFLLAFFTLGILCAQDGTYNSENIQVTPEVEGTLMVPTTDGAIPLVIIIAGSGPTDRDGNQNMMKNNSLRYLAEGLYTREIASFRYDKRIVSQLRRGVMDETEIRFDDFIEDAKKVVERFVDDSRFSSVYVAGHSQGSLVGMLAGNGLMDGFISIAGAGQEIDDVIVDQLAKQAPGLVDNARTAFDDLRVNGEALSYSPGLASIFRPDIQPFIYSWMQYNPQTEIAKLEIPVLIVNGTKDLQVQVSEAEKLKAANPKAQYAEIENMNHILKEIRGDDLENSKSYNEYNRPIIPELLDTLADFIKS